jgi:hypothetical protein
VAPRLAAPEPDEPAAEDEVLFAVLEEVTVETEGLELLVVVVVVGGGVGEPPPNIDDDADMALRDDPRLPL